MNDPFGVPSRNHLMSAPSSRISIFLTLAVVLFGWQTLAAQTENPVPAPSPVPPSGPNLAPPQGPVQFHELPLPGSFFQPMVVIGRSHIVAGSKGTGETTFTLFDLATGAKGKSFSVGEINPPLALSPGGKILAGFPNGFQKDKLLLVDTQTGETKPPLMLERPAEKLIFLDEDRLASFSPWDKTALILDLKTGKRIGQINFSNLTRPDQLPIAFSANGKVAAYFRGNQLFSRLLDSQDETLIGILDPGTPFQQGAVTLACSPDGKEVTVLFDFLNRQHLQSWNLENKTPGPRVELPPVRLSFSQGSRLLPTPDGRGFLVNESLIVERKTLKKLWSLPDPKPGTTPLVFPAAIHQVLRLENKNQTLPQTLQLVVHTKQKELVDQAIQLVQSGRDAQDAMLPPLKTTDRKKAKTIPIPLGGVPWIVSSPPKADANGLAARPFPIGFNSAQVGQVHFASAEAKKVAVEIIETINFGQPSKVTGIDGFDLFTGKKAFHVDFANPCNVISLSPGGTRILTTSLENPNRVDLFTTDGKPFVSWAPYGDLASEEEKKILFIAFLSDDKILSISNKGMAIVWDLPTLEARFLAEFARFSQPTLSHDRKTLFFLDGELPRAFQSETLEPIGDGESARALVDSNDPLEGRHLIVSPDGKELVAMLQRGHFSTKQIIATWDAKTGKNLDAFEMTIPMFLGIEKRTPLQFVDRYLLINQQFLVDRESKSLVWNFLANTGSGRAVHQTLDNRLWYLQTSGFQQPMLLGAAKLPDPAMQEIIRKIQKKEQLIIEPGTGVSIEYSFGPRSKDKAFIETMDQCAGQSLDRSGLKFSKQAPIVLQYELNETDTGKTRVFFRRGNGNNPEIIKLIELEATVRLSKDDETLWKSPPIKWTVDEHLGRVPAEEKNVQEFLRNRLYDKVLPWAKTITLPSRILNWQGKYISLPGTSHLTPNGWVMDLGK